MTPAAAKSGALLAAVACAALLLFAIDSSSQAPPTIEATNPRKPKTGSPSRLGPPETVMTMAEPTIRAATTMPTTSRLTAVSS